MEKFPEGSSGRSTGPTNPPARLNRRLGVVLRHYPAKGRRMANQQPMPEVRELGLGVVRLTASDLQDPATRQRAEVLAACGLRFLVRVAGYPSAELIELLETHRAMILALEAVLPRDALDRWRRRPPPCPVPVRLAPLRPGARGNRRVGFDSGELDRLTELDLNRDGVFAGVVARLGANEPVFPTALRMVAALSAREFDLTIDLDWLGSLGSRPEQAAVDESPLEPRAAEAAFAANALPDAEIVLDSPLDVDHAPDPLDRLLEGHRELRPAGRAVRTISSMPPLRPAGFAWSVVHSDGCRVHGYESAAGIELLVSPAAVPAAAGEPAAGLAGPGLRAALTLDRLQLPVDASACRQVTVLTLGERVVSTGRASRRGADPRRIEIAPPASLEGPLIVRLS